jgi:hypothetical protein
MSSCFATHGLLKFLKIVVSVILVAGLQSGYAMAARTFYIDFATGSDTNNGTAKSSPWKRAPGMQGAAGVAASTKLQPGDQVIFKGGVTWDHTAFQWNLSFKGAAGQPIYLGVDQTWFAGSSWVRPIFNGDHVALAAGSSLVAIGDFATPHVDNYVTLDNIEFKGLKAFANTWPANISHSCATYFVMQNLYIHDWELDRSVTTDDAHGGVIGNYPSCRPTGTVISHSVISNTEARDAGRQNGIAVRSTDIEYSVIHDVQTAQLFGLIHDSEVYNVSYPQLGRGVVGSNMGFDPTPYHENVTYVQGWDGVGLAETRPGMIYNNIFHDIAAGSGAIYPNGCPAKPFYIFNNVVYNNFGNQAIQIEQYGGSGTCGEYYIWNNTLQVPSSRNIGPIRQVGRGIPAKIVDMQNNHFIQDNGGPLELNPSAATLVMSDNVSQTNRAANNQGYTAANKFSPTEKNGATLNKGKNLVGKEFPLLESDILNRKRPEKWDAGAYQHVEPTP